MTAAAGSLRADAQVIGLVGFVHALSHFFHLAMAPLFPFIKDELGASYVELGAVLATFYTVSGVLQTAAGFVVDRFGPRAILVGGLALYGVGLALLGVAPSFPWLFAGAVLAGIGNSVFHPGDFALLNAKVSVPRLGPAFSVHGIAGNVGFALAPVVMVPLALATSWRTALLACAGFAFVCAVVVALQPALRTPPRRPGTDAGGRSAGWRADARLLASKPVVLAFAFFLLYATVFLAVQSLGTPALAALYEIPVTTAATGLTAFLLGTAGGMLAGGFIAARTRRHGAVAAGSMLSATAIALVLAAGALPAALAVAAMAAFGFSLGCLGPSRDILIREVAPPDARGKVYGFVYSGLDLGGLVAPIAFGLALDAGRPALLFAGSAALMVASIPTIINVRRPRAPALAPRSG